MIILIKIISIIVLLLAYLFFSRFRIFRVLFLWYGEESKKGFWFYFPGSVASSFFVLILFSFFSFILYCAIDITYGPTWNKSVPNWLGHLSHFADKYHWLINSWNGVLYIPILLAPFFFFFIHRKMNQKYVIFIELLEFLITKSINFLQAVNLSLAFMGAFSMGFLTNPIVRRVAGGNLSFVSLLLPMLLLLTLYQITSLSETKCGRMRLFDRLEPAA